MDLVSSPTTSSPTYKQTRKEKLSDRHAESENIRETPRNLVKEFTLKNKRSSD